MSTLEELREKIDTVDTEILQLLQKRITIMRQVGEAKKELQLPIRDSKRETLKSNDIENRAEQLNIPKTLVRNIWKLFFEISEEVEL